MALDACKQALAGGMSMVWENASYAINGSMNIGYKISNYMLGGTFREIVMGAPTHRDATLRSCERLLNSDVSMNKSTREKVLSAFDMNTEYFEFQVGHSSYQFRMRCFESINGKYKHTCVRIGGKDETSGVSDLRVYPLLKAYVKADCVKNEDQGLRIFQLSLHHHLMKHQGENSWQEWKPVEAKEVSQVFFAFLKKLQEAQNIQVDSLMCHSMGSIVLENLDAENAELPPLLILDRALPSLWKVGRKLHYLPTTSLLYGGACMAGWAIDPEKRILQFFEKSSQKVSLTGRKVIVIEVKDDWYFSDAGAFSKEFTENLSNLGLQAHRKCFAPNDFAYHTRSHHALSLGKLENDHKKDEASILPLEPYESAASGIIKYLMVSEENRTDL